ncbi:MAG: efflux RND transporter periplasmic adaptor subunit [Acidobacteriaceae bacterium]
MEVRAARAEMETLTQTKSTNGKVDPVDGFEAHAPISGEVKFIDVHLGEQVAAGQELVRMDDTEARKDLASAQALLATDLATLQMMEQGGTQAQRLSAEGAVNTAQLQVRQDRHRLASLQHLAAEGAASANEVAQAQEQLQAAQTQLSQAQAQAKKGVRFSPGDIEAQKAQVAEAQAAVQAARALCEAVDIRAPFAGTVYSIPVVPYQFVQSGDALVYMANLNKMEIRAYFDEPEIGMLQTGQPVSIVWAAKPGEVWHGHILQAPKTIITYAGTRNVGECLISVDDANGVLLPNTNVTVTVTEMTLHNVLSLPREALHTDGVDYVFRIVGDRLVMTPVKVGLVNLQRFQVLSGLKQGDMVALGATTEVDLTDGLRVKVRP